MRFKTSVKFWNPTKRPQGIGRFSAGCLMLVLWLGAFAVTASPDLHRLVHHDAQNPAHECWITQIQSGMESGFVAAAAPAPVLVPITPVGIVEVQFIPAGDPNLSPSRGPPSVSFFRLA